jgi:hypothetical protein
MLFSIKVSPFTSGLPAGALAHEEDDRADRVLDQLALNLATLARRYGGLNAAAAALGIPT